MSLRPRGDGGGAMPVVLAFASVGLIVVLGYLAHQARANNRALRSPAAVQAALNARSGVYRAIDGLLSENEPDTLKTISAADQAFRMGLFDGAADSARAADSSRGDSVKTLFLYANDSANTSDITVSARGIYSRVTSRSNVRGITRAAEATLGCPAPTGTDTVLILENILPVIGRLNGRVGRTPRTPDTLSAAAAAGRISKFISDIKRQNPLGADDTSAFDLPLTVRSSNDLAEIPDVVRSHLLLDGTVSGVTWRARRRVEVYGDLQVSGAFRVENLEFSVGGEVRILDDARLAGVYVFSSRRIFIGDGAVFQGDAVAMGSINVYGRAEVTGRSSLIAAGVRREASKYRGVPNRYSITFSESAKFDGTAVALGNPGGIKTGPYAEIHGILWAQRAVCHGGKLSGVMRAEYLFDCTGPAGDSVPAPLRITENVFAGSVMPLLSIGEYRMPYFMCVPRIIGWREF